MAISGTSMGLKNLTLQLAFAFLICLVVSLVRARDIIVGDDNVWDLNGFNYTTWAQRRSFTVGDSLGFLYNPAKHDVYMVGGGAFNNCSTEGSLSSYNTGADRVELKMPGNMWFLCYVAQHCEIDLKFKITVVAAQTAVSPAESPMPGGALSKVSRVASGFMFCMFACITIIIL